MTMRLSSTVMEIWRLKENGKRSLTFWGSRDVIGHVTIRLPGVDFLRVAHSDHASISSTVMEIWPFEVLPGRLLKEQRSVVGLSVLNTTLISYTPLHYVRNVARKE